jgi:hypothetical protein
MDAAPDCGVHPLWVDRRHSVDLDALVEPTSTTTSCCDDLVDLAA